ncbi:branched-chain amino acid ABC transporter permease [Haloarchaeobius sp. HRN-SO-5]|uniref:branched-chain amino acid ABC transporter permease n=1 Tax=Haloarchaeobius sp. HRN-SO-5 TaxID=3446118 RepID=UPI003EBC48AF
MAISDPTDAPDDGVAASTTEPDGGATATADSADVASETATDEHYLVEYLRKHVAHALVVGFFGLYPFVYTFLLGSPVGAEMAMFLPRVQTMITVFYFGLFAMSFDFISGYTGYLSFGHSAFYGLGAYFVILVANGQVPLLGSGTPFVVLLLLGGFLAVVLALLMGAVAFRLTGVYFAMITLGFAQILYVFFSNWDYLGSNPGDGIAVVGRSDGFAVGVPYVDSLNMTIGQLQGDTFTWGMDFAQMTGIGALEPISHTIALGPGEVSYYMVGLVVLVCYFTMQRIIHSPFGRAMIAIRENEERARAVGYDTFRVKMGAFAISGFFGAIAGGLFAGYRTSVAPENSFYFLTAGDALLASIIGGFGTVAGPLFGRLFHEGLHEFLTKEGGGLLPYLRSHLGEGTLNTVLLDGFTVGEGIEVFLNGRAGLYIGLLFVLFVLYVPNGLLGTVRAHLGGTVAERAADAVEARVRGWKL